MNYELCVSLAKVHKRGLYEMIIPQTGS